MRTTPAAQIGRNVRAEMVRAGISQKTLSDALGITQSQLSKRLAGRVPFSGPELLAAAAYLQIPAGDLVTPSERHS